MSLLFSLVFLLERPKSTSNFGSLWMTPFWITNRLRMSHATPLEQIISWEGGWNSPLNISVGWKKKAYIIKVPGSFKRLIADKLDRFFLRVKLVEFNPVVCYVNNLLVVDPFQSVDLRFLILAFLTETRALMCSGRSPQLPVILHLVDILGSIIKENEVNGVWISTMNASY